MAASPKGPICTRATLACDLGQLGLRNGDTVLVHSSLRNIGWVCGGAEAVVLSLLDTLGDGGTLVVPTHTGDNSDPSNWGAPPVPESWWETIRQSTPAFNPATGRTRGMGVVAETVRTWPGAKRSNHPQTSFAALGPKAEFITCGHTCDCMMGEKSPLARLEELKAKILLLGVGFDCCTALHLAESRVSQERAPNSFAAMVDGTREWVTVEDMAVRHGDFEQLGQDFVKDNSPVVGKVGAASCYLIQVNEVVAYAEEWFRRHRH